MATADPTEFANRIVSAMVDDFRPAMESLGADMQSDIRELISVPVQYVNPGSARPAKPKRIGNRAGPGLVQRDAGAGGVHFTLVGGRLKKVVRSLRGEPPRKEFGFLYKSMTTSTAVEGNRVITEMGSDPQILTSGVKGNRVDYSVILEEKLKRPHFSTIFRQVESYAVDRILSRLPQTI